MVGLIGRQTLTERQYLRANRVMCLILVVSYITYIVVEVMNAKTGMNAAAIARCSIYVVAGLLSLILNNEINKRIRTKEINTKLNILGV